MNIIQRSGIVLALLVPAVPTPAAGQMPDPLIFEGRAPYEQLGFSTAGGGDLNGDGFDDLVIGTLHSPDDTETPPGIAYIHFGGAAMDTIPDLVLTGGIPDDWFGCSVAIVGDVNADGFDDVLVGAPDRYWDQGSQYAGRAYLFLGGAPMDTIPDLVLENNALHQTYAYTVAGGGDINGDGYDDFLLGAPSPDGRAEIYFGGDPPDGTPDLILRAAEQGDFFGWCVANAGDLNGDGFSDVLVGAPIAGDNGKAYLFHGGATMDSLADVTFNGEPDGIFGGEEPDQFGSSVAGLHDVNGDGWDDIGIGKFYDDAAGTDAGKVYVYFGGAGMDPVADLVLTGYPDSRFGNHLAGVGDLNGDGFDDMLVGAYNYPPWFKGRVDLFLGGPAMDSVPDTSLFGKRTWWNYFGWPVAAAGDINGDGRPDVLIGEYAYSELQWLAGRVYLHTSLVPPGLIRNPGFESGLSPWAFYTDGAARFITSQAGRRTPHCGTVEVTVPGNNVQLYQSGIRLEPNCRYRLGFWASSNTGHDLTVSLHKHTAPYTVYGLSNCFVNVGRTWQYHAIEFTSPNLASAVDDGRLRFWFAPYDAAGDRYSIDDVCLEKLGPAPPADNAVANPDFEEGVTPWNFFSDGAGTFSITAPGYRSAHAAEVSITVPGANTQLFQSGIVLLPNTRYRLSFAAFSTSGHDMALFLQRHDAPYTTYGLNNVSVNLTGAWTSFAYEFTTRNFAGTVSNGRLRFRFDGYAAAGDRYFLDKVVLKRVTGVPAADERQQEGPVPVVLGQNHPNPFNSVSMFEFRIPSSDWVEIALYDLLGRKVATLVNERVEAGLHTVTWDAAGVASGVYLYRMRTGAFLQTRRMVLLR